MNRKQCRTCLRYFDRRKDLISLFDFDPTTFTFEAKTFADMLLHLSIDFEVNN